MLSCWNQPPFSPRHRPPNTNPHIIGFWYALLQCQWVMVPKEEIKKRGKGGEHVYQISADAAVGPHGRPAIFDKPIRGQNQRTSDMAPRMPLGCPLLLISDHMVVFLWGPINVGPTCTHFKLQFATPTSVSPSFINYYLSAFLVTGCCWFKPSNNTHTSQASPVHLPFNPWSSIILWDVYNKCNMLLSHTENDPNGNSTYPIPFFGVCSNDFKQQGLCFYSFWLESSDSIANSWRVAHKH